MRLSFLLSLPFICSIYYAFVFPPNNLICLSSQAPPLFNIYQMSCSDGGVYRAVCIGKKLAKILPPFLENLGQVSFPA